MIGVNSSRSIRTNIYYPDGEGRDSYIFCNNGGFFKCGNKFDQQISSCPRISPTNNKLKYAAW